jgi:hypothetical protein
MSLNNITSVTNTNFLSPTNFILKIDNTLRNVEYTCQVVSLPSISLGNVPKSYRGMKAQFTGDSIEFDTLSVRFIIDETMENYKEIIEWTLSELNEIERVRDLTLLIYSSSNNVSNRIRFIGAFPISVDAVEFDSTLSEIIHPTCTVMFSYTRFEFIT